MGDLCSSKSTSRQADWVWSEQIAGNDVHTHAVAVVAYSSSGAKLDVADPFFSSTQTIPLNYDAAHDRWWFTPHTGSNTTFKKKTGGYGHVWPDISSPQLWNSRVTWHSSTWS